MFAVRIYLFSSISEICSAVNFVAEGKTEIHSSQLDRGKKLTIIDVNEDDGGSQVCKVC